MIFQKFIKTKTLFLISVILFSGINLTSIKSQIYFEQAAPPSPELLVDFEGVRFGALLAEDVDNDGDKDVLITGFGNNGPISFLHINDGNGNFSKAKGTSFEPVYNSSADFADIDGDEDLDLIIIGENRYNREKTKIYRNDGNGNFSLINETGLEDVTNGSVKFSDIDGDLDEDLLITGSNSTGIKITKLYENDGNGNFSELKDTPFEGVDNGQLDFADVNGDNAIDILITGGNTSGQGIAKLYLNNGFGDYVEALDVPFEGVKNSSLGFSDVDNDNDADLLITGLNNDGNRITKLYFNNGNGIFSEVIDLSIDKIYKGSVNFSDFDGDNDADLLITGRNIEYEPVSKLYENDGTGNFDEVTSVNFIGTANSAACIFDFNGDNKSDILISGSTSSNAADTNFQLYENNGNNNYFRITGTNFDGVDFGTTCLGDIDSDNDLDLFIAGLTASGSKITKMYKNDGIGNFNEVIGTPFEGVYYGTVDLFDANGDDHLDLFITGLSSSGRISKLYVNDGTGAFTENTDTIFEGVYYSAVAISDIDGDEDQDLLITGRTTGIEIIKLYVNDGNGSFKEETSIPFKAVYNGSLAFSDIDLDGDNDLILTGEKYLEDGKFVRLYLNDGTGNFSEVNDVPFTGVSHGNVTFTDVDGDNDNDVIINGWSSDHSDITKLYKNNGSGIFNEVTDTGLEGSKYGALLIGDVDNDNDNDIIISGTSNDTSTKLYSNNGNGLFNEVNNLPFDDVFLGNSVMGDVNQDNYLDIILTGKNTNSAKVAKLYINSPDFVSPIITSSNDITVEENIMGRIYSAEADENVTFNLGSNKDEDIFTLYNEEISFKNSPDYENPSDNDKDNVYLIDLIATDRSGNSSIHEVSINVLNIDDTNPTITSPLDKMVNENIKGLIYTATADEPATFNLGNRKDERLFTITDSLISFTSSPDFENPTDRNSDNLYLIDLIVTDTVGNQSTQEISISVTDIDEIDPNITSASNASIEENISGAFYTITADESVTFSLGSGKDEGLFILKDDEISFETSPDFENPGDNNSDNGYLITLEAVDKAGNTTSMEILITVTDLDEAAPTITSATATSIEENLTGFIYTANADENVNFMLGISKDEDLFILNDNRINFINIPDYENPIDRNKDNIYEIDLIAEDSAGNSVTEEITFTIINVDDTNPIITSSDSIIVEENVIEIIYTITANEKAVFSLGDEKDEGLFTLSKENLTFKDAPDFENPIDKNEDNKYLLDIIATDTVGNIATLELIILIADLEEEDILSVDFGSETELLKPYPNPTSNIVKLSPAVKLIGEVAVLTDIKGKKIRSVRLRESNEIDLGQLPSGIYLLKIQNEGGDLVFRLVKSDK